MDIIIFGGQSNMQGASEICPEDNTAISGALEYRWLENSFVPLRHPVGENYGEKQDSLMAAAWGGSLVPFFCKSYIEECGRDVVAIHVARGNTTIGQWLPGTQKYFYGIQKMRAGIEEARKLGKIEHIYYVWLQGESDAVISATEEEYTERLITYKNALIRDLGIEKFCIIKVGYFCRISKWFEENIASSAEGKLRDEAIMRAQEKLPSVDCDFIMLFSDTPRISITDEYRNFNLPGHFNNAGYELIGKEAGKALAGLSNKS